MNQRSFSKPFAMICLLMLFILSGLLYLNRASANMDHTEQTSLDTSRSTDPQNNQSGSPISVGDIAYVTLGNTVAMVDTVSQVVVDTIDATQYGCYGTVQARITPEGDFVYFVCGGSESILVLETTTNSVVTNIDVGFWFPSDIVFTQTGDIALVSSGWEARIAVIDTATYSLIQYIYTSSPSSSLVMHPFKEVAYATGNGEILVIDTSTFTVVEGIQVPGYPQGLAVSTDGKWIFSGDGNGNGFWVIDANSNSLYTTVYGMGIVASVEVSSNGAYIYVGGEYNHVWVIDGSTFSPITSVTINETAWYLELTCDETQLYVGNNTSDVMVIDALNFYVSGIIPMPVGTANGIAICPQYVVRGILLIPPEQADEGGRGETVTYQETLFNNSGITDTFTLEAFGYQWETQLSTNSIGPIASGETASITIDVTVPVDAPWYSIDSATILATGITSPSLTAEALIETTAFAPAQISVYPDSLASTQYVGEVITQTMTISNGEGVTLTYDIYETTPGNLLLMPLDEPAGSTGFMDIFGNNNGTCAGDACPQAGAVGRFGTALSFDGNNDYIQIGDTVPPELQIQNEISLEAWIYVTSYPNEWSQDAIVGCQTDQIGGGYAIHLDGRTNPDGQIAPPGHINLQLGDGFYHATNVNAQIQLNQWVHIVATRKANGDAKVYYNAVLQPSTSEDWDGTITYNGAELDLGRQAGNPGRYFNGVIDEVAIYDRALTAQEVATLYASGHYGDQISWFMTDPISGTVPDNGSIPVVVTFDATGLQPGVHDSALLITSNDPLQPVITVPITLTVEPTSDMGKVTGLASDAWTGEPITATVELEGVFSTLADPDYSIWAVGGTYSLTAYTEDYYTVTLPVEIEAGMVTEQDIALEPALPSLGELPAQISLILPEGANGVQELEMINNGPMALDFVFHEINPLKKAHNLPGMQILYDRAHCQNELYNYSILTADLVAAGATVGENFDPFDATTLEGYDILWLNGGFCDWTNSELDILDEWLSDGGAVLIQSEESLATTGPAGIFGISYTGGNCDFGLTTYINPHPITEGVDEVYIAGSCSNITGSPVEVVLEPWNMQPHVIAAQQGQGKMVVVADTDFIDWAINTSDNRLLAMNTFQWLALPAYSDIPWLSEVPEQGSVAGHSSLVTTLNFDATAISAGVYTGTLAIEHNDPNQESPVLIPVQLTVTVLLIPPGSVLITGPETSPVGQSLDFTAWVEPISTTLPVTYTWQADGQATIIHTGGLTDTVSFTWEIPGTMMITVTVSNLAGEVMDTHMVSIVPIGYEMYLPVVMNSGGQAQGITPGVAVRRNALDLARVRRR